MTPVAVISAYFLAGTFAFLSALHVGWAFRRSGPSSVVIPHHDGEPVLHPGPLSTLAVAVVLAFAAVVCLWRVGLISWGWHGIPRAGVWVIAVVFLARAVGDRKFIGFFKRVRNTPFARFDTWLYSPLCLLISGASVLVATGGP